MESERNSLFRASVNLRLAHYQYTQIKNLVPVIIVTLIGMAFNFKALSISLLIIILGLIIFIQSNEFIRLYRANEELTAILHAESSRNSN